MKAMRLRGRAYLLMAGKGEPDIEIKRAGKG
jgi:hypothetical protein